MPLATQLAYHNRHLYQEAVALQQIAAQVGTPFYCYSRAAIENAVLRCKAAFEPLGVRIHYAVKANANMSVLRLMAQAGLGADIVSGGELERAVQAGIAPRKIVFSGVGKQGWELTRGVEMGIGQFNIESQAELDRLERIADGMDRVVAVAVRVNPDIDANTHRHITTGVRSSKFGLPTDVVPELLRRIERSPHLRLRGLAVHIGSQIREIEPYRQVCRLLSTLIRRLGSEGLRIEHLDLGGGFAVDYGDGQSLAFETVAQVIEAELLPLPLQVAVEPGRSLVAEAGVLVSRVIYRKQAEPRPFLILDAGMNDLMRPALYQAVHPLLPLEQLTGATTETHLVGPICESTDQFQSAVSLPAGLDAGDLVAFQQAGAYAAVMAGTYNSRDLIPEVLVEGATYRLARPRLTQRSLITLEQACMDGVSATLQP